MEPEVMATFLIRVTHHRAKVKRDLEGGSDADSG
jgi:hypothetical protein